MSRREIDLHGILMMICAAQVVQERRGVKKAAQGPAPGLGDDREDELQEIVGVPDHDADDVDGGGVAEDHREGEKYPGQVRRRERKEIQKSQAHVLVTAAPNIDHHEGERGAQEGDRGSDEWGNAGDHARAEENHEYEVGRASSKRALF